jgi:T5SS/PEP-CTERM-associated repeat protein
MIWCRRLAFVRFLSVVCLAPLFQVSLHAAINSLGDVSPVPPVGGGSITTILRVGNNTLGTMDISGGTGLSQNTDAFVGSNSEAIGIVSLSGFGSDWIFTLNNNDLTVGSAGLGTVSLENLARVEVPAITSVGFTPTGVGEINIDGVGTIWNTETAAIGVSGHGEVNITGGGRLVSESSTLGTNNLSEGRVVIADALSQWLVTGGITVGNAGRGTVTILDGGMLRTTIASIIGSSLSGTGTVEVNGTDALWNATSGNVTVGSTGTGKLHVFNGGRVSLGNGILQLATTTGSRGEVWVDGLGTSLTVNGSINSGVSESQLTISNGAEIVATSMTWGATGRINLQNGRLKVTGQGAFSSSGLIGGSGTLEATSFTNALAGSIRGRVQVGAGEHLRLTNTMVNSGLVDLNGGELEVSGALANNFDIDARNGAVLRVGGLGLDNNNGAQLAITAGEIDVFGAVDNNDGSQILVASEALGVFHDTITNNGDVIVQPGAILLALEQLNFLGNSSSLSVQLDENDTLDAVAPLQAAGTIILEGDLTVMLSSGYQPEAGDVFPLLHSDTGLAGVFFNENLPSLRVGLAWESQRTTNSLSLMVVESAGLTGDFDNDGDVDGRDFLVWQRGGSPSPLSAGDLADWQGNYGVGSLAAASVAVPEPHCAVLMLLGLAIALRQPRVGAYNPQ